MPLFLFPNFVLVELAKLKPSSEREASNT